MDNSSFGTVNGGNSTTSLVDGSQFPMRMDHQGAQVVSPLRGKGYESAYRGKSFSGANQAGATTTVGLATTYTGLCLSNPIGSGVNLVVNKVSAVFLVAFAAASAVGIMVGYSATTDVTHTTPGAPKNNKYTGAYTGVAKIDTAATLPVAPVVHSLFASGLTGAITTGQQITGAMVDMDGSLIIPPGGYCAIYTSTASGASSMLASFNWDEVPQ